MDKFLFLSKKYDNSISDISFSRVFASLMLDILEDIFSELFLGNNSCIFICEIYY